MSKPKRSDWDSIHEITICQGCSGLCWFVVRADGSAEPLIESKVYTTRKDAFDAAEQWVIDAIEREYDAAILKWSEELERA